jgi:hypothetical protein
VRAVERGAPSRYGQPGGVETRRWSEIRKRAKHVAVVLSAAAGALLWPSIHADAAAQGHSSTPGCRPLRAVFYAEQDWLRLAAKLAEHVSPCAQYYISIPPTGVDKTNFRRDQASRIRAKGPNFHALAEVHMGAWRKWVTDNNATWYQAGVEARRRMAVAGFDVTLGDDWVVNELSSGVRRDTGVAREEVRELVHGLYDGSGGPPTKGAVLVIGINQPSTGSSGLSNYKGQLEVWLQDSAFWEDMSRYVSDWSQELYGDVRNYAVPDVPLASRRDSLNDYLQHQLVQARVGGKATAAARSFLDRAYSPLANAAWQWDFGFGWTMVSADQMEDYVSAQIYALRHFSALDGQPQDHWGFAWRPRNATGIPPADFTAQTNAILDRLATAIHDSAEPLDPADPGVGACGPPGQNLWCSAELAGAWLNHRWKTFTYWGRLRITSARFGELARFSRGRRHVFGVVRLRVCADSAGPLVARFDQALRVGRRIRAKGTFTRKLASTAGPCRSHKLQWPLANAFLARGRYTVRLRLREAAGTWSKPVQHSRRRLG